MPVDATSTASFKAVADALAIFAEVSLTEYTTAFVRAETTSAWATVAFPVAVTVPLAASTAALIDA